MEIADRISRELSVRPIIIDAHAKVTYGRREVLTNILHAHIDGRVPLIAAGGIRTPGQAEAGLEMGLAFAAVGQGLVINPDWMTQARNGRDDDIRPSVSADDASRVSIPQKLWAVIDATPGWFNVTAD